MAHDYETLKAEMEKAYPGYKFLDAEVKYNGVTAAFYIYARMVRNWNEGRKEKWTLQTWNVPRRRNRSAL